MGKRPKEHPLLRALVVCGASLVGIDCGGVAEAGDAQATTVRCPEQCSSPAQFTCDDLSTATNCRCVEDAPLTAESCASVWDFSCKFAKQDASCSPHLTLLPDVSCECSHDRLHPEDCEQTAQFRCDAYPPAAEGCRCDLNAPTGPEDCGAGLQYTCHDRDPDIDCVCAEIALIK